MGKAEGKRIDWLDISKGIAIIMVVVGHISSLPWEPYRKIIFSVHMPLFFIVAGYTTKMGLNKDIIKKLLKRLFVPYCVTFLISVIIAWIQTHQINLGWEIEKFFWASGVPADYGPGRPVTGESTIPVIGALWFLPCMFFCKIICSVLLKYIDRYREAIKLLIVLFFVIIGYIIGSHFKIPMGIDIAVFCVGFMYSGYLLKKYNIMGKKIITVGFFAMVLWYMALKSNAIELSARFYRDFPFCLWSFVGAIAGSYVIFVLSDELINKIPLIRELLIFCGKNSLVMLCVHVIEGQVINWQNIINIDGRPFVTALCIAAARTLFVIIVCFIIIRIKDFITKMHNSKTV